MKKRLFELLDEMNQEDGKKGTAMLGVCHSFISADKVKGGTKIAMGAPDSAVFEIMNQKTIPVLLLIDAAEYEKRKDIPKQLNGIDLIAIERSEQKEKHGITIEFDATVNDKFQLTAAASFLCAESWGCLEEDDIVNDYCPTGWEPSVWEKMVRKPYEERLIIAGALIAAEIDRLKK